jgi:hypothetical protein
MAVAGALSLAVDALAFGVREGAHLPLHPPLDPKAMIA